MKNLRLSTNIWSILARSSLFGRPSATTVKALYPISTAPLNTHVSRRRSALYSRPLNRGGVRHAPVVVFAAHRDDDTPKINCAKCHLCRAMLRKRGLCRHAVSVCPSVLSVGVSVTFVNSVKTNKRIIKIFSPSDTHTILVYLCQTA